MLPNTQSSINNLKSTISLPPRRRGAQPGNHNARRDGTFSRLDPGRLAPFRLQIHSLTAALNDPAVPTLQVIKQALTARNKLDHSALSTSVTFTSKIQAIRLSLRINALISRVFAPAYAANGLSNILQDFAQSPLTWFEYAYRDSHITRDADSFYPVPIKSVFNPSPGPAIYSTHGLSDHPSPPLPTYPTTQPPNYSTIQPPNYSTIHQLPNYSTIHQLPNYATNLTDSQWSILAPLIPPDPHIDWLTGEPPVIIAANRWHFTEYSYTGDFQDIVIMQEYHKILAHCPGLLPDMGGTPLSSIVCRPSSPSSCDTVTLGTVTPGTVTNDTVTPSPGRPRTSPRLLLDAILWKMATGHTWSELPAGFPPPSLCSRYYRRLYRSGRWYTLILALYNHFRMGSSTDLVTLVKKGTFTTTRNGKLALHPRLKPTWQNCTALLFMQLARAAWSVKQRVRKQAQPYYPIYPLFKGFSPLTTGLPPGVSLPQPASKPPSRSKPSSRPSLAGKPPSNPFPDIEPLEDSLAWKKWQKLEKDRQIIQEQLARLLNLGPPASI